MRIFILILIAFIARPLPANELQQFTADYEIFYGDIRLGKANYRFSHVQDQHYRFDFVSDLSFLIFWDDRIVSTDACCPFITAMTEKERARTISRRFDSTVRKMSFVRLMGKSNRNLPMKKTWSTG
jgi:hypothetical protein